MDRRYVSLNAAANRISMTMPHMLLPRDMMTNKQ